MALLMNEPMPAGIVPAAQRPVTLGVIVGNRGFFPDHLAQSGREIILDVLKNAGVNVVIVDAEDTNFGSIESYQEAKLCGELFSEYRNQIDGILVTLPNFGDERGIANAIRLSGLDVPVLIQAFPDDPAKMDLQNRRDSFCGKMSACNNLYQYGISYSLTKLHTVDPQSDAFRADLENFKALCRTVRMGRRARLGALGARPTAFNTVRYSEKLLELHGVSVETLDLSEVFGRIDGMTDNDDPVVAKRGEIEKYARTAGVPEGSLNKMAKLGVVLDDWMTSNALDATAIQCWTSMEEYFGIVPCTVMSMLSNGLTPSACETDIAGSLAMLLLAQASQKPSALVDWNNNYGDDPDKGVVFHCSNLPKDVFIDEIPVMQYQEIIAGTVGVENTYGTIYGRVKKNPFTYLRVSTDDITGTMRAYVGEGAFTDDPIDTFGGYGVVEIPRYQDLLAHICEEGYEHHVTINQAHVANPVDEAMSKYLGWDVYHHQ
jgi:L-fucose isomerase-like protein